MQIRNTTNQLGWMRYGIILVSLVCVALLAGCGGAAPVETSMPSATQTQGAPRATATGAGSAAANPSLPVTQPAAGSAETLTAEQALASAPSLPTQAIPMLPSPVASELPQTTPSGGGPATPAGAALSLPPTPVCANLALTPPDTEGPYFLDNTPERNSFIEPGMTGTRLIITGYVLTPDCRPVPSAQIEFWQAGPDGQYDLQGYRFRGHLFSDDKGFYRLETILPAVYEGRPRHIHVKVLPQNAPGLTTQLYFPDDSPLPALTVAYDETPMEAIAVFTFVVAAP